MAISQNQQVSFADVYAAMPTGHLYQEFRRHLVHLAQRYQRGVHELENELYCRLEPELGRFENGKPLRQAIFHKYANIAHLKNATARIVRQIVSKDSMRLNSRLELTSKLEKKIAEVTNVNLCETNYKVAPFGNFLIIVSKDKTDTKLARLAELLLQQLESGKEPRQCELAQLMRVNQSTICRSLKRLNTKYNRSMDFRR